MTIYVMEPQPVIRRIEAGWDISGIPYFMGSPEYHLRTDQRFQPPAELMARWDRKKAWVERREDTWVWVLGD